MLEGDETVDVTEEACHERCPAQWSDIDIQPTRVDREEEARPRPWLESIAGRTNLPQGLSTVQLAKVYGLNQSTASRWLASARERLWEVASANLQTEWPDLDPQEIRRLSREWAGQIDLSLSRLLTV